MESFINICNSKNREARHRTQKETSPQFRPSVHTMTVDTMVVPREGSGAEEPLRDRESKKSSKSKPKKSNHVISQRSKRMDKQAIAFHQWHHQGKLWPRFLLQAMKEEKRAKKKNRSNKQKQCSSRITQDQSRHDHGQVSDGNPQVILEWDTRSVEEKFQSKLLPRSSPSDCTATTNTSTRLVNDSMSWSFQTNGRIVTPTKPSPSEDSFTSSCISSPIGALVSSWKRVTLPNGETVLVAGNKWSRVVEERPIRTKQLRGLKIR